MRVKVTKVSLELSEFNINVGFKDRQHVELLKRQIEAGYELPIEVYEEDGVYKIIDGGHAWEAYKDLGREPENVRVLTFKDDAEKIAYSRHKNINRLQQTPVTYTRSLFEELKLRLGVETDEEVKKILRRQYNLKNPNKQLKENEEDRTYHNVMVGVFQNEPITWESFTQNNLEYLNFPLWLAEMVDRGELSAAQGSVLNSKRVVEKLDEDTRKRIAALLKGKSVKETRKGIDELIRFEPQVFNVWNFPECNPLFGMEDAPGRIPGQIVQNVLHYWTREGDLVVDPMAGGGTTVDVCNLMRRRCLAYDKNPLRDDIEKRDLRKGFPSECKNCDLIFLDPPYWRLQKGNYGEGSVSELTYQEWLEFMKTLAENSYKTVKKGGHVSLLLAPFLDERDTGRFLDLPFECAKFFEKAGFIKAQRVSVPMTSQIKDERDVEYAKKKRILLDLNRDLIVFRKS